MGDAVLHARIAGAKRKDGDGVCALLPAFRRSGDHDVSHSARLGPIGEQVVAKVLIGLLAAMLSYLKVEPRWTPTLAARTTGRRAQRPDPLRYRPLARGRRDDRGSASHQRPAWPCGRVRSRDVDPAGQRTPVARRANTAPKRRATGYRRGGCRAATMLAVPPPPSAIASSRTSDPAAVGRASVWPPPVDDEREPYPEAGASWYRWRGCGPRTMRPGFAGIASV